MRHSFVRTRFHAAQLLVLALLPVPIAAQTDTDISGDITGTSFTRIKIAAPAPGAEPTDAGTAAELVQVLRDDLEFSGFFDVVDPTLYRLVPPSTPEEPHHEDWISIGADSLVQTHVRRTDDRVDVEARLYDNASGTVLFARRYGGRASLLRRVAHQVSDDLVLHYTGRPGVALTRIAFVSNHGEGKEIYLADYDGKRVRRLTTTNTINLSPVWSADGEELAFVSWRGRQPGVYLMSSEGKLRELKTVGGELSAAPDWSPDGTRLVYSSDVDGNTELYVLDRARGRNRRLTYNAAIDTAPAFSPNGREIAFTSDRTGVPQIYIMDADGLNTRRISWGGNYNDSAAWSPRGDRMAYVSRIERNFHIVVMDLATERVVRLTSGPTNNENPSWSPDGRHLVFSSDRAGSYDIYTMRSDGSDIRRLTRGAEAFTPDWSR
jgi:TolB protein